MSARFPTLLCLALALGVHRTPPAHSPALDNGLARGARSGWGSARVRDLWTHTDIAAMTDRFSATVPAHGMVMVRITPIAGGAEAGGAKEDE